jgi:hypothetical protein
MHLDDDDDDEPISPWVVHFDEEHDEEEVQQEATEKDLEEDEEDATYWGVEEDWAELSRVIGSSTAAPIDGPKIRPAAIVEEFEEDMVIDRMVQIWEMLIGQCTWCWKKAGGKTRKLSSRPNSSGV